MANSLSLSASVRTSPGSQGDCIGVLTARHLGDDHTFGARMALSSSANNRGGVDS